MRQNTSSAFIIQSLERTPPPTAGTGPLLFPPLRLLNRHHFAKHMPTAPFPGVTALPPAARPAVLMRTGNTVLDTGWNRSRATCRIRPGHRPSRTVHAACRPVPRTGDLACTIRPARTGRHAPWRAVWDAGVPNRATPPVRTLLALFARTLQQPVRPGRTACLDRHHGLTVDCFRPFQPEGWQSGLMRRS